MQYVFLNPDGTLSMGLLVIVEAATGVTYQNQCAGYSTEMRQQEGFLIPVGDDAAAAAIYNSIKKAFKSGDRASSWELESIEALRREIAKIPCWLTDKDGNDQRLMLELDLSRMSECVEAWIPVKTPYGRGILVFDNSD